jgi:hypothetical protein
MEYFQNSIGALIINSLRVDIYYFMLMVTYFYLKDYYGII